MSTKNSIIYYMDVPMWHPTKKKKKKRQAFFKILGLLRSQEREDFFKSRNKGR